MEAKVTVDEELELEDELDMAELKARQLADVFKRARNSVKSNIRPLLVKTDNSAFSFTMAASLSAASFALAFLMLSMASRKTDAMLEFLWRRNQCKLR
jgi:hypothetical protein